MKPLAGSLAAALLGLATFGAPTASAATGYSLGSWEYNEATRHYYALLDGGTWADLEAYAQVLGGHVVTIESVAEDQWLRETFPGPWIYIGMNDVAREGTWAWASGKRVTYTNWRDTQPDDWKGFDALGEDAGVLASESDPGHWESISGRWILSGIVEASTRPNPLPQNELPIGFHDGTVDGTTEPAIGDSCNAHGWAWDPDSAKRDVTVRILAARLDIVTVPKEISRGPAGLYREDLVTAGVVADGRAGFFVDLQPLLEPYLPYEVRVQARDLQTGEWVTLDESPRTLTCAPTS